jgi:hypothetical protein
MSVIEDVRKVFQDLVAPELKSISVKLDGFERESKLRDENLAAKIDSAGQESKLRDESLAAKIEGFERESKLRDEITQARIDIVRDSLGARIDALGVKIDANHTSVMNALDLNRRVETLERDKQSASA